MSQEATLKWKEFEERFKPILNHIAEQKNPSGDGRSSACMGGFMFDTAEDEFAFVQQHDPHNVWTVIVSDDNPYDEFVDNYECADCDDNSCECGKAHEEADKLGLEPTWVVCKGFHIVNRNGYIITENPWTDEDPDAEY